MLSVIIPVYNAAGTLRRCVDSVLGQPLADFELLLVDDGSTDGSAALCDEMAKADSRVRTIHKPNGGVSSARNAGLDEASGEWIAFVDADDHLPEGVWTDALLASEADLIVGSFIEIKSNGNRTSRPLPTSRHEGKDGVRRMCGDLLTHPAFHTLWGKFFRRPLVEGLRLDERLSNGEDTLFLLRALARAAACLTVETPLYCYCLPADFRRKHSLPVEEAIHGLTSIWTAYNNLGAQSDPFMVDKFVFFREMCLDGIRKKPILWNGNKEVKEIFASIHEAFPWRTRLCYTAIGSRLRGLLKC